MIYFSADHHAGHENIIKYCNRPYANAYEMDEDLIKKWNDTVGPKDTVYYLGDLTLGGDNVAGQFIARLFGHIKFLSYPWHHDRRWVGKRDYFSRNGEQVEFLPPMEVVFPAELGYADIEMPITLCHYPLATWERSHHGALHLHGHTHGRHNEPDNSFDVGVDSKISHGSPVSIEKIAVLMYKSNDYLS